MSIIEHIVGREVLDSRGNPTVEVEVVLDSGATGRAIVPSGASTGRSRRSSCATAATATAARACSTPSATSTARSPTPSSGFDALDQRDIDRLLLDLDGTDNKGRLGANAILGVSLAVAKAAADELEPAALPLRRRRQRPRAAGADDERAQRRRARRQQRRLPGVHDHAGRRGRRSPRRCAGAPRPTTCSRRSCTTGACPPPSATRAASPRTSAPTRRPSQLLIEAIEKAGFTPGERHRHRPRRRLHRVLQGRHLRPRRRGPHAHRRPRWSATSPTSCGRYPIVSIEDGMAEEDWDGWKAAHRRHRRPGAARRRRPVRHQHRAPGPRHRRRRRQLDPRQGQPDRLAHRDARGGRAGHPHRLHRGDVAPLRRDRGHHHRRPRRGHQLRPDQDRRAGPLATAWPSTTSCCASRTSSARPPPTGARRHHAGEPPA